ncbi:hypothetical protein JET18_14915 [Chryseobacterium sp. L7]|uniref:Uncharacterized protein n=1 Tax=Chryseobacterium endalhagicum TaxID=2797638 RepID=A0ABS1QHQ1_9FLAO|nr:hypothetical protein [Chryseobacterium endalhagicum]MBL1222141.1 hypothetical protein [Chryseobacterium endalhagicum]
MKKNLTFLLTVLLTVVSVTSLFAQNSFSVKYVGQTGNLNPAPISIKVEADYNRHNFIYAPVPSSQTTPVLVSNHIANSATVAYLLAPTPNPNKSQSFELFHLKVIWGDTTGFPIAFVYTFNDAQILSANNGNEINVSLPHANIRLKAIHSGTHVLYQITLKPV